MGEYEIIAIIFFLLVCLMLYLWFSFRNLIKNRTLTSQDYLWKLKNISGKSEYDIFQIAAKEKGWSKYYVEKHFRRYLEDQTLPVYVKQFLEDGKEHINSYRCRGGDFFTKKALIFFSLFGLLLIGGSFIFCLYIYPGIYPFHLPGGKAIPRSVRPHIYRAILFANNEYYEKACLELKRACDLGSCEYYNLKKREGFCQ